MNRFELVVSSGNGKITEYKPEHHINLFGLTHIALVNTERSRNVESRKLTNLVD